MKRENATEKQCNNYCGDEKERRESRDRMRAGQVPNGVGEGDVTVKNGEEDKWRKKGEWERIVMRRVERGDTDTKASDEGWVDKSGEM